MRRTRYAALFISIIVMFFAVTARAAISGDDGVDTDTRLINAKVTEITDAHVSVMAQTGVEHVIAIDPEKTRVVKDGKNISIKEVREGDVINIELDEKNPIKFAKSIYMRVEATEVARNRR